MAWSLVTFSKKKNLFLMDLFKERLLKIDLRERERERECRFVVPLTHAFIG